MLNSVLSYNLKLCGLNYGNIYTCLHYVKNLFVTLLLQFNDQGTNKLTWNHLEGNSELSEYGKSLHT